MPLRRDMDNRYLLYIDILGLLKMVNFDSTEVAELYYLTGGGSAVN